MQSPSRLIRRHNPSNGSHYGLTRPDGSSSSNGHKPASSSTSTRKLPKFLAVAALSFAAGILLTRPSDSIDGGNHNSVVKPVDLGFEPPVSETRRTPQKPLDKEVKVGRDAHRKSINNHQPTIPYKTPRIIGLQITPNSVLVYQISSLNHHNLENSNEGYYQIQPSWYEPNAVYFMDGHDFDKCIPMAEWQLESFVDCNKFHELDLSVMRMINRGGSRIAFELTQSLPNSPSIFKFVYKTMRFGKEIDTHQIEQQRKDSLVMERTTSSQFIPSIHGYCSLAVMMDYMPEGNMHDYIKGSRILSRKVNGGHGVEDTSGKLLKPVDRLRVGIHIATSVADLHGIDGTMQPSYFHNDLCCHQYLFQDGIFKLNDFNYARPIYMDKTTKKSCTRREYGMLHWKGRSLEEHIKALRLPFDPPVPDKIDVWMMGNIIYYILTDLYTFEKPENLDNHQVGKLLVEGKRSPYPEYIEHSSDPSHIAMKKALDMCWVQNWRERPSAREISDFMLGELRKITGEENPDLRVVLPERDPNQTPSDGEYNVFND